MGDQIYRVACSSQRRPFAFINPLRRGQSQFSGLLVDLLPQLFQEAGLNASNIEFYNPATSASGTLLPNGTWTGLTGELISGAADIVLSQITARSARSEVTDQSLSVLDAQMALLVSTTTVRPTEAFTFLQPFTWQLWVCLSLMTFGVAVIFTILSRLSPLGRFDLRKICSTRTDGGKPAPTREYAVLDVTKSFLLDTWMTATGQTPLPNGRSWAVRMVGISYGLFSLLVIASYTAAFASILTLSSRRYTLRSMEELQVSKRPFGIDSGGVTLAYFSEPNSQLIEELSHKYVEYKDIYEALPDIREGKIAGYVGQLTNLQYIANLQPCDMAVVDKGWGYGSQVIMYQKNSTLTGPLDKAIVRLREQGTVDQILRGWQSQTCPQFGFSSSNRLELASFAGLWYMLFIFWGFAIMVALVERAVIIIGHRYPTIRRRSAMLGTQVFGSAGKHFDFTDDTFGNPMGSSQSRII